MTDAEKIEAKIRAQLDKPTGKLTQTDLENVTELWLSDAKITNISPLAECTQLHRLTLTHNQISDVSALAGLTQLRRLEIYDNQISDISALARMTKLLRLEI